jgi:hypothetical protein
MFRDWLEALNFDLQEMIFFLWKKDIFFFKNAELVQQKWNIDDERNAEQIRELSNQALILELA